MHVVKPCPLHGQRYSKYKVGCALAGLCLLVPVIGSAQEGERVELDLEGVVEPKCEIDSLAATQVDFSASDSGQITFDVYCNVEMSIGLSSRNGALVNEEAVSRNGPDPAFEREYTAAVSLDKFSFNRTATSDEMLQGVSFEVSEGVVFQTSGAVNIDLLEPVAGGRAGKYTDQIRISVTPSLTNTSFE